MKSPVSKEEFERMHKRELELRKKIKIGFRAGDRLSRDEVHERRREDS
jgi:hypothetical protein